jgi:hypothetical protein
MNNAHPTPIPKEQEAHLFYEAIGKALTNWQLVEDVLGILFSHLMSPQNGASKISATAAYHSVIGFRSRLALVDSAAIMQWHGPRLATWKNLKGKIKKASEIRNHFAHFSMQETPPEDTGFHLWLCPTAFDVRYIPYINPPQKKEPLRYNYKDIFRKGEMFVVVCREMVEFGKEVNALFLHYKLPHYKSAEPD